MTLDEPVVFVVADDRAVREVITSLIESVGLRVAAFRTAGDFLKHARPDGPTCVVLDVRRPGLSGLDVQRELARAGAPIPIVFVTGHGDVPLSVQAMKARTVEFLTKLAAGAEDDWSRALRTPVRLRTTERHLEPRPSQHPLGGRPPRDRPVVGR